MTEAPTTVVCNVTKWRGTPVFVLPALGKKLKRIFGATFLQDRGIWMFPAFYPFYMDVLHDIGIVVPEVQYTQRAQDHIDAMNALHEAVRMDKIAFREDFSFVTEPYEHQKEGLRFALVHPRCALFYDMGLGKTKIVIDTIRHEGSRALVLSPSVAVSVWDNEAAVHSGGALRVGILSGTPSKRQKLWDAGLGENDIVVTSFDLAKKEHDAIITQFKYDTIIVDESHFLRGYKSARTKCATSLASRAHRRVILSGTPSLGNPLHLYGQLALLGHYVPATDFWTFRNRYCITAQQSGASPRLSEKVRRNMIVAYKNLDHLNARVRRIAVRKKKEDCLDLPARTVQDIFFEVQGDQKTTYNKFVEHVAVELNDGAEFEVNTAAVAIQKMLQVLSGFFIVPPPEICDGCVHVARCVQEGNKPYTQKCSVAQKKPAQEIHRLKSNPKMEMLEEKLDSILAEERNKVIVWAWFREELNMIEKLLQEKEIGYFRVDGSNSSQGPIWAKQFNTDPQKRVWLGQVSSGVALTLTGASYMIYYSLPYDLGDYEQAMDRNYRIGQTEKVFVYRFVCEQSVLGFVATALSQKKNIASTLADAINCVVCKNSLVCLTNGVSVFGPGCVHKARQSRAIIQPKKL